MACGSFARADSGRAPELDVALRTPRGADEYRLVLSSTREGVAHLRQLVEGLTALARIDAGQVDNERERLRVTELADRALAEEAGALAAAGCTARLEVSDDLELDGHRGLLAIALPNLLRNAARHGERGRLPGRSRRRAGRTHRRRLQPRHPRGRARGRFDRFADS